MRVTLLCAVMMLGSCGSVMSGGASTLYRNSAVDGEAVETNLMRIHIATFDTADGDSYNWENCQIAQSLFQAQPGVRVKFWCEKGRYRR
jgi:hypothetical protein